MSEKGVALVTGGSRGIGRAICEHFARDGFRVHLVFRHDPACAEEVRRGIEELGGHASMYQVDVGVESEVEQLVRHIVEEEGRIDVLVNNAGITEDRLLASTSLESWERVLRTNLTGPFLLAREVVPVMLDQSSGCIVNITSPSVHRPARGQGSYVASKGGLEALTRALASELCGKGIRVNAVAPGAVATDMTAHLKQRWEDELPLARWGTPEEIAAVVAFLASDDARYISGQVLTVDGGRATSRRLKA